MKYKLLFLMIVLFGLALPMAFAVDGIDIAATAKGGTVSCSSGAGCATLIDDAYAFGFEQTPNVEFEINFTFDDSYTLANLTLTEHCTRSGANFINFSCWNSTTNNWGYTVQYQENDTTCQVGTQEQIQLNSCTTNKVRFWSLALASDYIWYVQEVDIYNTTRGYVEPPDTTPPGLLNNDAYFINGESIIQMPNLVLSNTTLPRINFTTNESATCAIMGNETGNANKNYTDMIAGGGVECETTGTTNHICTMQSSNAFTAGKGKAIYAGCKDTSATTNQLGNATFAFQTNIYQYAIQNLGCLIINQGCSAYALGGCNYIK